MQSKREGERERERERERRGRGDYKIVTRNFQLITASAPNDEEDDATLRLMMQECRETD